MSDLSWFESINVVLEDSAEPLPTPTWRPAPSPESREEFGAWICRTGLRAETEGLQPV